VSDFNPYELGDIPPETAALYSQLAENLSLARERHLANRESRWRYPSFDPEGLILDAANDSDRANPYFERIRTLLADTFVPYAEGHDGDLGLVGIVGPVVVIHKTAGCGDCGGAATTDLGVQAFLRRYFENPDLVVIALDDDAIESPLSIDQLVGVASSRMR
jgi:Fe-S cluster biogenesis protein NfuA